MITSFILVLVLLVGGEAVIGQKPFPTKAECTADVKKVAARIAEAGDVDNIIYLGCVPVKEEAL
jgi:hypothetical protein